MFLLHHCTALSLCGFLLCTTVVLATSTAHTCTYTAVRYCSITFIGRRLRTLFKDTFIRADYAFSALETIHFRLMGYTSVL